MGKIFRLTLIRLSAAYGLGAGDPVLIVVLVSVEVAGAGVDLSITVVLLSVLFSAGGLVTVVSFFSHATRKAMVIRIQMCFMLFPYSQDTSQLRVFRVLQLVKLWLWWWWWYRCRSGSLPASPFRFFARRPQAALRWRECRCIFS